MKFLVVVSVLAWWCFGMPATIAILLVAYAAHEWCALARRWH